MSNIVYCAASNGTGYHLLKVGSKRRRTEAELKDDKLEEELRDEAMKEANDRADRLEQQLAQAQRVAQRNENMAAWTQRFLDEGKARVGENGDVELLDP